jgi:anaerobic ribonucleoside-triphosphate reductase activating protein
LHYSTVAGLVELIKEAYNAFNIEGVTISGGEPFQQQAALLELIEEIRRALPQLSIIIFTGYTSQEVLDRLGPALGRFMKNCDVLIAGRYNQQLRVASALTGSANKAFHLYSERYSEKDFKTVPPAEVIIQPDGQIVLSGINPVQLTKYI